MGIDRKWSIGALRLSFGHTTTNADIDTAVSAIVSAVNQLRR
jgi:cysteine sulfinate desulfinase/cysteine desulfurase-like protein